MATATVAQSSVPAREASRVLSRLSLGTLGLTVVLLAVGFFVTCPFILLFINSFEVGPISGPTHLGLENWQAALTDRAVQGALRNTLGLALTRQAIAIVSGVLLAWLIARTDLPGRDWLEFGFWVAVFLPVLTVTLGWIMVFDSANGLANQLIMKLPFVKEGPFEIYSWWGIIWVHLMTGTLPVQVMLLTPAFRNLDASLEEASRACGVSTLGTLRWVVVPLLAPTILVVLILGTIRSLESFEVELILGSPAKIDVYSTLIYRAMVGTGVPAYGQATVLSMAILAVLLPLIGFQQWYTGTRSHTTVSGKFRAGRQALGRWRWPLFAAVFGLVSVMTILPIVLVVAGTFMKLFGYFSIASPWTLDNWKTVLGNANFTRALMNSFIISAGTAILAMIAFFFLAYMIVRTQFWGRKILDFLVWVPSVLPGIVIGLGYLWLFLGTPFLRPVYGTTWILIMVAALGSITLTTQLVKSSLLQLGTELEQASWTSGVSRLHTLRYVVFPLIAPTLAAVGVLAFSASAKATSQVALLSTNANQPLSMLQLNLMSDNNMEAASVVGVFILLMTIGVALLARVFGLRLGASAAR
jgi:iron(III) transport system permease protein